MAQLCANNFNFTSESKVSNLNYCLKFKGETLKSSG